MILFFYFTSETSASYKKDVKQEKLISEELGNWELFLQSGATRAETLKILLTVAAKSGVQMA